MSSAHDVIVIGGGLAGCATALQLARAGRRVLLLEEKRYPVHKLCGEFLSPEVQTLFRGLGVTQDGPLAAPAVHRAEELPGTLTVDSRIRPLEAARGFTVLAPPRSPPDEPREQKRRSSPS